MNFMTKSALALVPGLALKTPALALAPPDQAALSQPRNPIAVTVHGVSVPRTEIELTPQSH
jgi:hypothetical protein